MTKVRFALRMLGKSPLLTTAVVISLGLGIGANTAIFSLLEQVLIRSLPVQKPEELVVLTSPAQFKVGRSSTSEAGGAEAIFSYRVFRELERHQEAVTAVAGFRSLNANLSFRNQTVDGSVTVVSGSYFPLLGVRPMFGRLLTPQDDIHRAGNAVAVLSFGYWKDRLGGVFDVLNQPVRVNGHLFTIVGVAPKYFTGSAFDESTDVYVPLSFKPLITPGWDGTDRYDDHWLYVLARRKPGVTLQQAEDALNTVYRGLVQEQAKTVGGRDAAWRRRFAQSKLILKDGHQGHGDRESSRAPILILMASTGLVLLIAMANAANLLLARTAQRRKELAIRAVMGAARGEIIRQLLVEALLLSLGGGALGIVLGTWTLELLIGRLKASTTADYSLTSDLNWQILLFALGASLLTGLLFGLYPAWEAARNSLAGTLKDEASHTSPGQGAARVRKLLVCIQVTIAALLLIPTGLFLKSLVNLMHVDLGLRTENVIKFKISPELNGFKPEQSYAIFERAEQELAAVPGVSSVTTSLVPLIANSNRGTSLTVEGYSRDPNADTHSMLNVVGPGFFGKLGTPLISGREFTDRDNPATGKVAVVNQQFARYFFQNQNPIGRRFTPGLGNVTPDVEIVGVAKDSHYAGVKQEPPRVYYVPWRQDKGIGTLSFYVRTSIAPEQIVPQIRRVMAGIDRDLPLAALRTLQDQVMMNVGTERLVLQLAAAFAALATLLAMLGLYGVMAYSVTRRTREIGIRMALGAEAASIRSMVLREVFLILGVGLLAGIPGALALARMVQSQLFGVKAYDGPVVVCGVLALVLAALVAGYLPARRATRVSPMHALHYE